MSLQHNLEIVDFLDLISDRDEYYANASEKAFIRNYDECDDYHLRDAIIEGAWEALSQKLSGLNRITLETSPITIMHTNAGSGKVLEACPSSNVFINALNNDYTCKKISDLLNASASIDFGYKSSISDISHYFINGCNGNTQKYDIVFTQPIKNNDYYREIDGTRLSTYGYLEYYSVRSLDFVTKGGYLCIFTHDRNFIILKNNKELNATASLVKTVSRKGKFDEYGFAIYKKN